VRSILGLRALPKKRLAAANELRASCAIRVWARKEGRKKMVFLKSRYEAVVITTKLCSFGGLLGDRAEDRLFRRNWVFGLIAGASPKKGDRP